LFEDALVRRTTIAAWLLSVLHEVAHSFAGEGVAAEIVCDQYACRAFFEGTAESQVVEAKLGACIAFLILLARDLHGRTPLTTHPPAWQRFHDSFLPYLDDRDEAVWSLIGFVASLHRQNAPAQELPLATMLSYKSFKDYALAMMNCDSPRG
jgi:hypothetical protein